MEKSDLVNKLKAMSPEERKLFRESLQEADPVDSLSPEELSKVREMLGSLKDPKPNKKTKGPLTSALDSIFGE